MQAFKHITSKSPNTAKLNKVLQITFYFLVPFFKIISFTIFVLHTEVKFSICPNRVAAHFKNGTKQGSVQNSCCLQSKMGKGRTKNMSLLSYSTGVKTGSDGSPAALNPMLKDSLNKKHHVPANFAH